MDKRRMLIVDDNAFNRQVLCELFDMEFDIVQAGDGIEALELLYRHAGSIAVVLLDIVMPKKDGLDVLREMLKSPQLRAIPVIVTSAAADDVFRLKALELGAVDYISTPFNPMLVKLRVKSTLATREYDRLRLQNEMLHMQQKEGVGYRAVLEDTHTAILEFDGQGHIRHYDATIKHELAGDYDHREFLTVLSNDGVADADTVARIGELFQIVIHDESVVSDHVDAQLLMANGAHSWFRLRLLRKIDDASGEAVLVMSISNVDQQKREEEATRSQLIHALNAAESADVAKSEFMARMSHEIRTPLNAIIGFLTLARGDLSDTERLEEYLAKAEFASKHLLSIINDVLDMSAIDSGRMTIGYESYDLKELINAVTSIVYSLVHKKNQQFQIMLDGVTEERVMGDKMRLSQILLNLLSNAIKFTPQNGRVVLTVRQRARGANRVLMDFAVTDNGIGMSNEFLERLGQPFEQQDSSIAHRYGGSGLGLSITKNLVMLMGGVMTIDSEEGQGSTFTVTLPMDVEQSDPTEKKSYAFPDVLALIIDPEEMAAEHARACFRTLGCRCDCATSGNEALALYAENNYNLVLMDWKLPDLDGRSMMDAIRQAADGDPTIIIMAYDNTEISARAMPGLRIVHKPIFPSSALELLLQLYGKYEIKPAKLDTTDFQGKHLLLVEDNVMNMEIASIILFKMGFTITPVTNGLEACEVFAASEPHEYDAILMDVQMPLLNGYDATRRIRASAHPAAATIPIIAMTANAFAEDVADALECGMNDHIAKPIDVEGLQRTLAKHLLKA